MNIIFIIILVYLVQWATLFAWFQESTRFSYVEAPTNYEVLALLLIPGSIVYILMKNI